MRCKQVSRKTPSYVMTHHVICVKHHGSKECGQIFWQRAELWQQNGLEKGPTFYGPYPRRLWKVQRFTDVITMAMLSLSFLQSWSWWNPSLLWTDSLPHDSVCKIKILTVTQVGTRSHLLRTKIRCLCCFSFFRNDSMWLQRVPMGSRESKTWQENQDKQYTFKVIMENSKTKKIPKFYSNGFRLLYELRIKKISRNDCRVA